MRCNLEKKKRRGTCLKHLTDDILGTSSLKMYILMQKKQVLYT